MDPEQPVDRIPKERIARKRAADNVERWGLQPLTALLLAMAEELGELAGEICPEEPPEDAPASVTDTWLVLRNVQNIGGEVQDCLQLHFEADGEPLPQAERPPIVPERADMGRDEVREELLDLLALCYQLDWARYQGVRADGAGGDQR